MLWSFFGCCLLFVFVPGVSLVSFVVCCLVFVVWRSMCVAYCVVFVCCCLMLFISVVCVFCLL